jgi:hypothetical protein
MKLNQQKDELIKNIANSLKNKKFLALERLETFESNYY